MSVPEVILGFGTATRPCRNAKVIHTRGPEGLCVGVIHGNRFEALARSSHGD